MIVNVICGEFGGNRPDDLKRPCDMNPGGTHDSLSGCLGPQNTRALAIIRTPTKRTPNLKTLPVGDKLTFLDSETNNLLFINLSGEDRLLRELMKRFQTGRGVGCRRVYTTRFGVVLAWMTSAG